MRSWLCTVHAARIWIQTRHDNVFGVTDRCWLSICYAASRAVTVSCWQCTLLQYIQVRVVNSTWPSDNASFDLLPKSNVSKYRNDMSRSHVIYVYIHGHLVLYNTTRGQENITFLERRPLLNSPPETSGRGRKIRAGTEVIKKIFRPMCGMIYTICRLRPNDWTLVWLCLFLTNLRLHRFELMSGFLGIWRRALLVLIHILHVQCGHDSYVSLSIEHIWQLTAWLTTCAVWQVLVGITVGMITTSTSANSAAAVMLPELTTNTSDIPLTTQQGIWFGRCYPTLCWGISSLYSPPAILLTSFGQTAGATTSKK